MEDAIRVEHLSKMYKLYDKPSDRLKESLRLSKKKLYREHYALLDVSFDIRRWGLSARMVPENPQS